MCLTSVAAFMAITIGLSVSSASRLSGMKELLLVALCSQSVLLAGVATFGPGSWLQRSPLVLAWLLALYFSFACVDVLRSWQSFAPLIGLVMCSGALLPPTLLFAWHRWRTRATWQFTTVEAAPLHNRTSQFPLRGIFLVVTAFAFVGLVARLSFSFDRQLPALETPHDELLLAACIGFFLTTGASPALLLVMRPRWSFLAILLGAMALWVVEPFLLTIVMAGTGGPLGQLASSWDDVIRAWTEVAMGNGAVMVLVAMQGGLLRLSGLRHVTGDRGHD